jgi:hypothetical protein
MNVENEILHAFREWHRLAQAETRAIQTRNWSLLSDCHAVIKDFQAHIAGLTQEARAEWRRNGFNPVEKEKNLHVFACELIELTRRNQGLLQTTIRAARKQLDQLGEAGKNLKLLQRSYGFAPGWSRAAA